MESTRTPPGKALIWVHTDAMNPEQAALNRVDADTACFVWDVDWLQREKVSLKRVVFLAECLQEMPAGLQIRFGKLAAELLQAAADAGASHIVAERPVDPALLAAAEEVSRTVPVIWLDPPAFVEASRGFELKRFSRYWQRAESSALRLTAKG